MTARVDRRRRSAARIPTRPRPPAACSTIIEYTLATADDRTTATPSWAAADQQARTLTYHPEQQFTSDLLFEVPPDADARRAGRGRAVARRRHELPLAAFQPAGVPRVYVLGGCADVLARAGREAAAPAGADRPRRADRQGRGRRGQGAADARRACSCRASRRRKPAGRAATCARSLAGVRPDAASCRPIPQEARGAARAGHATTWSSSAAARAARRPASPPPGKGPRRWSSSTCTAWAAWAPPGAISSYYWGNRVGFTATDSPAATRWVIEQKMEWWRSELLEGRRPTSGSARSAAARWSRTDSVIGAVVATPHGRGVVLAKVVIDATGNADVAAAAGAECDYTDETEFGMQGTGLPAAQARRDLHQHRLHDHRRDRHGRHLAPVRLREGQVSRRPSTRAS